MKSSTEQLPPFSNTWRSQPASPSPTDIFDVDAGPLAEKISEWAGKLLEPYLKRHPQNPTKEAKIIHDPIGKAVLVMPWEVYVLDSPLLQRLRAIRQLGVGHFLFPTSGYSRFEHSLGSMHAATVLFDTVSSIASEPAVKYSGDSLTARRDLVRLAALCHDIGHAILSHVSERFYETDPEVLEARKRLKQFYRNDVAAAEVVAILTLRSDAFKRLLAASGIRRSVFQDDVFIDRMCACIAGSKYRMVPDAYLAEVVNGPVDCDKMDYLARDAHMAGVPVSLDIERLCSKLRIIQTTDDKQKPIYSIAIVPSGARALEEMLVSRIFLYDKFYYHAKIMAAEELVRRALHYLSLACPDFRSPRTLLDYGDDEFLSLTPAYIAARYNIDISDHNLVRGCELLSRARNRDLPKRAFAFARRFIPELPEVYSRLVNDGNPDNQPSAVLEYIDTDRLLNQPGGTHRMAERLRKLLSELTVDTEVFVAHRSATRAAGKMEMRVKLSETENEPTPDFLFNVSKWSDAYAQHKQTSFVFAYDHLAEVHIAAERLLAEQGAGMEFGPKCWIYAKLSREELDSVRAKLPHNDSWLPYRLPPDFLRTTQATRSIDELQRKFASFLNGFDSMLGPALVESWLWQLPDADLQETAIRLLKHIEFIDKNHIVAGFAGVAAKEPNLKDALWMPLRPKLGPGGSADLVRYDLKTIASKTADVGTLSAEDIRSAKHIVLFDDLLNNGVQAECLLSSWFLEAGPCLKPSDGDKSGRLRQDVVDALKSVRIDFVFYSTHPAGVKRLRDVCSLIGLSVGEVYHTVDASLARFTLDGLEAASPQSKQRLLDFLTLRGGKLLTEKHAGDSTWTSEQTERFALGYGGLRMTLLYRHSVSTALPAALWQHSKSIHSPWLPIFPRDEAELRRILDPLGDLHQGREELQELESD